MPPLPSLPPDADRGAVAAAWLTALARLLADLAARLGLTPTPVRRAAHAAWFGQARRPEHRSSLRPVAGSF